MKKLLLSAILVSFALFAFTQSLEIYYDGELVPDQSSITLTDDVNVAMMAIEVGVKNVGSTALDVKTRKFEVSIIPGSVNMFCWGLCFPPYIFESPDPINIAPGETCEEFSGEYQPNGNSGVSIIRYTFFDMNNPND